MRVYCGVYTAPDPHECRDLTLALHERHGFTAFKLSPYRQDLHAGRWGGLCDAAAAYFGQLRQVCPSEFEFAFDAHAKIFEPYQAIQLGNALAPYDPAVLRGTDPPGAHSGLGSFARRTARASGDRRMPVFALRVPGPADGGRPDIIQPDICAVGGVPRCARIAALAEAHYVTVAPHNPMGPLATAVNVHFAAAQPNFKILEYKLRTR